MFPSLSCVLASVAARPRSRNGIYIRARCRLNRGRERSAPNTYQEDLPKETPTREELHATIDAAVPRRPCRQPVAAAGAEGRRAPSTRATRSPPRSCARSRIARSSRRSASRKRSGSSSRTDGEFRRSWWQFDFFGRSRRRRALSGRRRHPVSRRADQGRERADRSASVGFSGHPMLEHFRFLKAHTRVTPKMTIPAPEHAAFSPGPRSDQRDRLSRPRRRFSTMSPRPIARRCAPSTTPAAAICSSTTPPGR